MVIFFFKILSTIFFFWFENLFYLVLKSSGVYYASSFGKPLNYYIAIRSQAYFIGDVSVLPIKDLQNSLPSVLIFIVGKIEIKITSALSTTKKMYI